MRLNCLDALATLDIPDPHGLVERAGGDAIGRGIEVDAENQGEVTAEDPDAVGRGTNVPDAERAVIGGRADVVGVRGPGDVRYAFSMAGQGRDSGEGFGGPDDDGLIERGRSQQEAIVGEAHA